MTKVTDILPTGDTTLNSLVSEAFVQFFVEIVGHYSLHMNVTEKGERVFQREPFRKSHGSRTVRHFLHCFMETQMFAGFIQDRELSKNLVRGTCGVFFLVLESLSWFVGASVDGTGRRNSAELRCCRNMGFYCKGCG